MKKYLNFLLGLSLVLLVGCQLNSNYNFLANRTDAGLTASVKSALVNNSLLASAPINVEIHQGIVTLSGYVATIRQSDTAIDVASKVDGVKGVKNNLVVRKS